LSGKIAWAEIREREIAQMDDSELRGLVLNAIYQRRGDGRLIDFDALKLSSVPPKDVERILSQLEEDGLIERTFRPLSGFGNGRITARGTGVIEGKESSSLAIQLVVRQSGAGNIQKVNVAAGQSQAGLTAAPRSSFLGALKEIWNAIWTWITGRPGA
jgi:hypothetical protein